MDIQTHKDINAQLCGKPILVEKDKCVVKLTATDDMRVDDKGLVHGGYVFGLADYAAMIAVNHPNVVLGSASVKFIKPVKIKEELTAQANVEQAEGKKQVVNVTVADSDGQMVFEGQFVCFILGKHVLD